MQRRPADSLNEIIKDLLDDPDRAGESAPEIFDTDVRERLIAAVMDTLVDPKHGQRIPIFLGLFPWHLKATLQVWAAMRRFTGHVSRTRVLAGHPTPWARLAALQNANAVSSQGSFWSDYFGELDNEEQFDAVYNRS
jgi:hypothetical protein